MKPTTEAQNMAARLCVANPDTVSELWDARHKLALLSTTKARGARTAFEHGMRVWLYHGHPSALMYGRSNSLKRLEVRGYYYAAAKYPTMGGRLLHPPTVMQAIQHQQKTDQ